MSGSVVLMVLASIAAGAALLELVTGAGQPKRWRPAPFGSGTRRQEPRSPAEAPARWAAVAGSDERTERLLDAAGRIDVPDAAALGVRRRVSATVCAVWAAAIGLLLLPSGLAIGVGFVGAAVGRALPGLALTRAGHARTAELREEVPELLDLLAVGLGCGLPVGDALAALGEWGDGPLATGAGRAAAELGSGAGLDQTLARLVRDHPVAELEAAVAIIQRARRHGTPAAGALRALAAGAREARARRAMDHAARAAPRVQLVAALLLVPAALCVLASALVAGGLGG
ncbi:MAG: type II secretion system F family protein [Solirubrobacteraceae bacterium]|nr:type II secretion system F family protein [Solirubrobacteraceae bacterium]